MNFRERIKKVASGFTSRMTSKKKFVRCLSLLLVLLLRLGKREHMKVVLYLRKS